MNRGVFVGSRFLKTSIGSRFLQQIPSKQLGYFNYMNITVANINPSLTLLPSVGLLQQRHYAKAKDKGKKGMP